MSMSLLKWGSMMNFGMNKCSEGRGGEPKHGPESHGKHMEGAASWNGQMAGGTLREARVHSKISQVPSTGSEEFTATRIKLVGKEAFSLTLQPAFLTF